MTPARQSSIEEFPLSPQQKRIWNLQLRDGTAVYSAECTVLLEGMLDRKALRAAIDDVVSRHRILQTRFLPLKASLGAHQTVIDNLPFAIQEFEDSFVTAPPSGYLSGLRRAFDFERDTPLRALLVHFGPEHSELFLRLPALCADSRSLDVLIRDLSVSYSEHVTASVFPRPNPPQYATVATWLNDLLGSDDTVDERDYWQRKVVNAPGLPLALSAEPEDGLPFQICERPLRIGSETRQALEGLARFCETGIESVLLAGWCALLWRVTGAFTQWLGVASDGRGFDELAPLVGPLARHLPLGVEVSAGELFGELVRKVAKCRDGDIRWQDLYDPNDIERTGRSLAGAFAFEPALPVFEAAGLQLTVMAKACRYDRFPIRLSLRPADTGFVGSLEYDGGRIPQIAAEQLATQFLALLQAADAHATVRHASAPDENARRWLSEAGRGPVQPRSGGGLVHERFSEWAEMCPNLTAVVCGEDRLSYGALNEASDVCAEQLRDLGVGPEKLVAILMDRSADFVVAILAVLKAAAAYLPLDPMLPPVRLLTMIREAAPFVLITTPELQQMLPANGMHSIALGWRQHRVSRTWRHNAAVKPDCLAYAMYTSGSTGTPQAVCVPHSALRNYVLGVRDSLDLGECMSFAAVSTFAADLAHTAIFSALCGGGCLYVLSPGEATDAESFSALMRVYRPDCLKIVPSHLRALLDAARDPADLLPRKRLVLGGERLDANLMKRVRELAGDLVVCNHYGPTETTVGILAKQFYLNERLFPGNLPPLGRPFPNVEAYVLDENLNLVPAGAVGELFVGGEALARGYLGRPGATALRFIPSSFGRGARLYRTGDLVRLLPDGDFQFVGRADDQVKVHGIRVEPAEVEAALRSCPTVQSCAVVARRDGSGLVAYVVPAPKYQPSPAELRRHLRLDLPDSMVPSDFVFLDALPLNSNGKLDRSALPAPEAARPSGRGSGVPPRNDMERSLALIWAEVLNLSEVGIHEDFFELGGDSILSILIVSRASRAGIRITPQQVFEYPTVAGLATVGDRAAEPFRTVASSAGPVPLTPIQRWLLEREPANPDHYNQGLLVELDRPISPVYAERALAALIAHHDALRLRLHRESGGWEAQIAAFSASIPIQVIDLGNLSQEQQVQAVSEACREHHRNLSLSRGPLVRMSMFYRGSHRSVLLLFVAHHVAVDGVSWQVLLEDFELALDRCQRNEEIALPQPPTSFAQWARALERNASKLAWKPSRLEEGAPLPFSVDPGNNVAGNVSTITLELDSARTAALLQRLPAVFDATVQSLLIGVLARGLAQRAGLNRVELDIESHGREPLEEQMDLSRTVGWLTARYPLTVECSQTQSSGGWVISARDALRQVPLGGVGFGLLRYLHDDKPASPPAFSAPQVSFNYLGQVERRRRSDSIFANIREAPGPARDPHTPRANLVDVAALVASDRLAVSWTWPKDVLDTKTVESLAGNFQHDLIALIDNTSEPWEAGAQVREVYELSPLQEGMLFDCLLSPHSSLYLSQFTLTLYGPLHVATFERAWRRVMTRHSILRTAFFWERLPRPLQAVYDSVGLSIDVFDWRKLDAAEQSERRLALLAEDRNRSFDLRRPPLMRISLVRLTEDAHLLLWSRHHLLLDGWSSALVLREVFTLYGHLLRYPQTADDDEYELLGEPAPYSSYVRWLRRQEKPRAEQYWRGALAGLSEGSILSRDAGRGGRSGKFHRQGEVKLVLEDAVSQRLHSQLRTNGVTASSLAMALWATLLAHLTGRADLVFGVTLSGRAPELAGAESIVGLLITTLPMRARMSAGHGVFSWSREFQRRQTELQQFQYCSLTEIQAWAGLPRDVRLFDTVIVVGNYPIDTRELETSGIRIGDPGSLVENSMPLTVRVAPQQSITLELLYDPERFDEEFVRDILDRLALLWGRIAAWPDATLEMLVNSLVAWDAERAQRRATQAKDAGRRLLKSVQAKAARKFAGDE